MDAYCVVLSHIVLHRVTLYYSVLQCLLLSVVVLKCFVKSFHGVRGYMGGTCYIVLLRATLCYVVFQGGFVCFGSRIGFSRGREL